MVAQRRHPATADSPPSALWHLMPFLLGRAPGAWRQLKSSMAGHARFFLPLDKSSPESIGAANLLAVGTFSAEGSGDGAGSPRPDGRPSRPVPVIVLLDVSGSMLPNEIEDKIGVLNDSMAAMLSAFAWLDPTRGQVAIGVVAFGGAGARVHRPFGLASGAATWTSVVAEGKTPMGEAFRVACQMLDDPLAVPEDSFAPVLVLVSDGVPTDDWEPSLDELLASKHGVRALRIAIGVGADRMPDAEAVLARFASAEIGVLRAEQAQEVPGLFRRVVATVTNTGANSVRTGYGTPTLADLDRI
jgi:uncharacterized protein YegL